MPGRVSSVDAEERLNTDGLNCIILATADAELKLAARSRLATGGVTMAEEMDVLRRNGNGTFSECS